MYCWNCGEEITNDQKICAHCGVKLNSSISEEASEDKIKILVNRFRSGDQSAFQALYELTYLRNRYIALKYIRNESEADDVLQDAYLKVYTKIDQYTYTGESSFQSWTSKIVNNTALNHLRIKNPALFSEMNAGGEEDIILEFEDENTDNRPELVYDKKETSKIVQELVDRLPDDQRISVMMFYYEEMSVKDIASEVGVSENTIKSRLNYARKSMMSKAEELRKEGILTGVLSIAGIIAILRSKEAMAMQGNGVSSLVNVLNHVNGAVDISIKSNIHSPDSFGIAGKTTSIGDTGLLGSISTGLTEEVAAGTGGGAAIAGASSSGIAAGVTGAGTAVATGLGLKITLAILAVVATISIGIGATVLFMNNSEPIVQENTTSEAVVSEAAVSGVAIGNQSQEITTSEAVVSEAAVSGVAIESQSHEIDERPDPFKEFISSNVFLCDSEKKYDVIVKLSVEEWGDGEKSYRIKSPMELKFPKEIKGTLLSYCVDDFDMDNKNELLILSTTTKNSKDDDLFFESSYPVAHLKLDMYEDNEGVLEHTAEYNDFGEIPFSGGIESWSGSFSCFSFHHKDQNIIGLQEEGAEYNSILSDGWHNLWFAALNYNGKKFVPINDSFVNISYSGGDESFSCNSDTLSLNDSPDYRIKELKSVGINYRFGEFFDYTSPDPFNGGVMPSDKVKNPKIILDVKNDDSNINIYAPSDKDKKKLRTRMSTLSFSGGMLSEDEDEATMIR